MDLQKAIDAHMQWRVKLRAAIGGGQPLDTATVGADNQCELGRWLASEGRAKFGAKPEFQKLVATHRVFHQVAGQAVTATNAGRKAEAEGLLTGPFSTRAQETVAAIQACMKACA